MLEAEQLLGSDQMQGVNRVMDDDNISKLSEEDNRREMMVENLKQVTGEPNPDLMRPYRIPVAKDGNMNLDEQNESLHDISSDESKVEEPVETGDSKKDLNIAPA